jgi:hypothetical protein
MLAKNQTANFLYYVKHLPTSFGDGHGLLPSTPKAPQSATISKSIGRIANQYSASLDTT